MPDHEQPLAAFRLLERALAADVALPPLVADAFSDLLIAYSAALGTDDQFSTAGPTFEAWFQRHWREQPLFMAEANDICPAVRALWTLAAAASRLGLLKEGAARGR